MSDIFIPGIRSRLNTDQLIEDLMRLESIPRDRTAANVSRLEAERSYWRELGFRTDALRESSRTLFSFNNPFNDRMVNSSDSYVLTGTANRGALEQERSFMVRQVAQSDRFLSSPLENNFRVEAGNYSFTVGNEEINFEFRGGTLREFTEALNRRGRELLQASIINVRPGTQSLLIESRVTGEENRLNFHGDALGFGESIGMIGRTNDSRRDFTDGIVRVEAGNTSNIPLNFNIPALGNHILRLEIFTEQRPWDNWTAPRPPPGPSIPGAGSISYGGIVIQNDATQVNLPTWTAPEQPRRVDNMGVLHLTFTDGSSMQLPPITDSQGFNSYQYNLAEIAPGRTIASLSLVNDNTHRDITIRNVQIMDPSAIGGITPLNAVSTAQDAIVAMEGIEIRRPGNDIDDLIPGVTITARTASDRPVTLRIEPDREVIKDAIISFVGNYNRLMAEINILTRNDDRILDELTYLSREERAEYRERLGAFSGDSTLNTLRNNLMRIINTPYQVNSGNQDYLLLAHFGVSTDARGTGSTGADASRLRGYLEIDERVLDAAIATRLPELRDLFALDTTGDLLADTGVAFAMESLMRPYTETGGLIALRTGTVNTRIEQENRRLDTLDRQLAARELELRRQYAQMEGALNQMERMTGSLDNFMNQNNNNR